MRSAPLHLMLLFPASPADAASVHINLAFVQINEDGNVLLDTHVRPKERVTDFRTAVSGITPGDVREAPPLETAMARAHALLQGRTVVGHALHNDFKVRRYSVWVVCAAAHDQSVSWGRERSCHCAASVHCLKA